jgi:uncharacterized membrane protein YdbT with pleckstrin-like domain
MSDTPPGAGATAPDYEAPEWLSLDTDEEIRWLGEPAPVSIVGTAAWGLLLTVVLIGFLILLFVPVSWLSIKNTDYVVTDKTLYVKKGVLGTNIESVALDKIQNTEYSQSFWGKQFGFGSIDISTAGSSGAEISFRNISGASDVREQISSLSDQYAAERRSSATSDDTAEPATSVTADGLAELVDELRATRRAMERVEQHLREDSGAEDDDRSSRRSDTGEDRTDGE